MTQKINKRKLCKVYKVSLKEVNVCKKKYHLGFREACGRAHTLKYKIYARKINKKDYKNVVNIDLIKAMKKLTTNLLFEKDVPVSLLKRHCAKYIIIIDEAGQINFLNKERKILNYLHRNNVKIGTMTPSTSYEVKGLQVPEGILKI